MTHHPESMQRVFLDSTVLFAAAIGGGCAQLWKLERVALVTSEYAAREAWDCLRQRADSAACRDTLIELLSLIEVVPYIEGTLLYTSWRLTDPKDVPILLGAIESNCRYLLTADKRCFGRFFGEALDGVMVLQPGTLMAMHGL